MISNFLEEVGFTYSAICRMRTSEENLGLTRYIRSYDEHISKIEQFFAKLSKAGRKINVPVIINNKATMEEVDPIILSLISAEDVSYEDIKDIMDKNHYITSDFRIDWEVRMMMEKRINKITACI